MLLKSLEIQGFKTFPDKTVLKFEESMVAVVGPNGSGKSNVSDAIRWVLGEQSARALRCSKMEDVIFKGTTGRKALGYAEVTMNIDNSGRSLNFEGDSVSVTRRYYRSGESEYLINKASVRLKDINELFMDTGLGRDGYSMIGQGKIDSIVSAKSEERREIFEEASGISRFRYRKEESERRLEKTEENLVRLRDILTELEDRIEPLRIQSEKAQSFLEYDGEKRGLEIGIWVETLNRSGKILREHEEKMGISKAQHDSVEDELETAGKDIEANIQKTNACTLEIEDARATAAQRDEEALRLDGQISVLENDILHSRQNITRVEMEILEAKASEENIDGEIAAKQLEIEQKHSDIEEHNRKYIEASDRLEALRRGSDGIARQIDEQMVESTKLNAEIAKERVRYSSLSSSLTEIEGRGGAVDTALEENQNNIQRLKLEREELSAMLGDLEEQITARENTAGGYSLRLEGRQKKAEALKGELDKLRLDAQEQSRRARILEDLERNLEGFTHSVKAVMKDAERGMLGGIHGPVTRILHTPRDYAVAIETALGAAMQNIVVGTEQDAKAAIAMLKKRDSGRATFLPLSTIRGSSVDVSSVKGHGGFVGIASALVECDEQYRGVKESLLGRTVVAKDLDSAVEIAKKAGYRFRIVTLDGQVVNTGGSLTGGSLAKNSGLLSRGAEIERIKEKALELQGKAVQLEAQYKALLEEISQSRAQAETARAELAVCQEDKIRITAELSGLIRELESTEALNRQLTEEKLSSQERLKGLREQMEQCFASINNLELQSHSVEKQLEELGGSRQDRQLECDTLGQQMQEIRMWSLSAEKDRDALLGTVEGLKARKLDSAGVYARLQAQAEESEERIEGLKAEIEQLRQRAEEVRRQAAQAREKAAEHGEGRNALEQQAAELRKTERELIGRREALASEIARLQERTESLQKEYDTIISKLWEEYELTRREAEEQGVEIEDLQKAQRRLTELKNKIRALGAVNVAAVVEYQEVSERYVFLKEQVGDVEKSRLELLKLISELTHHMQEQFSVRFAEISRNFTEIFKELFGGGTASLSFSDENDILSSGIDIKVHPPGKIVSHIEALSGGEKALVAISIYFAIMKVSPPPFCMLDEVEAALDDANVRRFADYLHKMNGNTQFIVVTHRRGTMEGADMLYGVTMQEDGISKLLALKTHEVEEKLGMKNQT